MDHKFIPVHANTRSTSLFFEATAHYAIACYRCMHCEESEKFVSFAVRVSYEKVTLLGTFPPNCEPLPEGLLKVADFDQAMLLKGYEAEMDGYGLGAYAYYRRVVENRWQAFLSTIREVAVATHAGEDILSHIDAAKRQRQFEQAVTSLKDALPREFFHKGHNMFTMLHSMASIGVHNLPEEECLAHARALRFLLVLFVRRADQALAEVDTLEDALKVVGDVVKAARTKATP